MNFDQPILDDEELNFLIQKVRSQTGKQWKVVDSSYKRAIWFGLRTEKVVRYRVYEPIGNGEYLVVKFCCDPFDEYDAKREVVVAFLLSLFCGELVL